MVATGENSPAQRWQDLADRHVRRQRRHPLEGVERSRDVNPLVRVGGFSSGQHRFGTVPRTATPGLHGLQRPFGRFGVSVNESGDGQTSAQFACKIRIIPFGRC